MELVVEIFPAVLCAAGLALVGWWLLGRLLRPVPGAAIWVVIPGEGEGGDLEQTIRFLIWLRSLGLLRCPIRIRDEGLTPEGRRLAQTLCRRWAAVELEF